MHADFSLNFYLYSTLIFILQWKNSVLSGWWYVLDPNFCPLIETLWDNTYTKLFSDDKASSVR